MNDWEWAACGLSGAAFDPDDHVASNRKAYCDKQKRAQGQGNKQEGSPSVTIAIKHAAL